MSLRRTGSAAAIVAALLASATAARESLRAHRAPTPPNVIIYLIDTLRPDHLAIYGYERATSPSFDAFAREGVVFDEAYAQTSWTRPSVGSLFTGLLPSRHGAQDVPDTLRPDVPKLAELLKARGYATGAILASPVVLPVFGFGAGFDFVSDVEARNTTRCPTGCARAADVHEQAYRFLDQAQRPFFLYVHTIDPHRPYDPPRGFGRAFKRPGAQPRSEKERELDDYDGEILYADSEFRSFLARLRANGLLDESIVVLLSDHGEEFWEHGGFSHGKTLFEEVIRVPLIVRLPGGAEGGRRVREAVRIVDVMPTILDLLKIEPPHGLDGLSFSPLLRGARPARYDPILFSELRSSGHVISSLIDRDLKLIRCSAPDEQRGDLLFDLNKDPAEQRDLSPLRPELLRQAKAALATFESALNGGIYLRLWNAERLDAAHEIAGRIWTPDGSLSLLEASGLEGGELAVAEDGKSIRFRVRLHNTQHPFFEASVVDHLVLRFAVAPGRRFALQLELDGKPFPAADLRIGDGSTRPRESFPSDDPALLGDARSLLSRSGPADRPVARLYRVEEVTTRAAQANPEVWERLRALGYVTGN